MRRHWRLRTSTYLDVHHSTSASTYFHTQQQQQQQHNRNFREAISESTVVVLLKAMNLSMRTITEFYKYDLSECPGDLRLAVLQNNETLVVVQTHVRQQVVYEMPYILIRHLESTLSTYEEFLTQQVDTVSSSRDVMAIISTHDNTLQTVSEEFELWNSYFRHLSEPLFGKYVLVLLRTSMILTISSSSSGTVESCLTCCTQCYAET